MILVEGSDDRYVLENIGKLYQVELPIHYAKGQHQLPKILASRLKEEELAWLGLVVDTDEKNPKARFEEIREWHPAFRSLKAPDSSGTIIMVPREGGMQPVRFGLWLMPDNVRSGCLEDFLAPFVPSSNHWDYAQKVCSEAKVQGTPFPERHLAKARMHTWLAWQKTPGLALGRAVEKQYFSFPEFSELCAQSPGLAALLAWIDRLRLSL